VSEETPEFQIQKTIRSKVHQICGELDLLKHAIRHLMNTHGSTIGRWDMKPLEHEIEEAHSAIGQVAYTLHSFGPGEKA
jgi:hypothetical protein